VEIRDETLAREDKKVFAATAPASWPAPRSEIQDAELLLIVELPDERECIQVSREDHRAIEQALNRLMPSTEPLGIWTVAICWRGAVVDSILANDL